MSFYLLYTFYTHSTSSAPDNVVSLYHWPRPRTRPKWINNNNNIIMLDGPQTELVLNYRHVSTQINILKFKLWPWRNITVLVSFTWRKWLFLYLMFCLVWILILSSVQRHKLKFDSVCFSAKTNTLLFVSVWGHLCYLHTIQIIYQGQTVNMRTQILNNIQIYWSNIQWSLSHRRLAESWQMMLYHL